MANFHTDEWIMTNLKRHNDEAIRRYGESNVLAQFYTGSGNYNADREGSDVDSWAIVVDKNYDPSTYRVERIEFDNEVMWVADIRAYINGMLHGDWVYLLPFHGKYQIFNPKYKEFFDLLSARRNDIAYTSVIPCMQRLQQEVVPTYVFLVENIAEDKFRKNLYYLKQIWYNVDGIRNKKPFAYWFYRDDIAEELLSLKHSSLSREAAVSMAHQLQEDINSFHPSVNDYPPHDKKLIMFCYAIKDRILEVHSNG